MRPDQLRRVEALFREASALPPQDRPAFLDARCAGDREAREEIERRLGKGPTGATGLMESIDLETHVTEWPVSTEQTKHIGSYRILQPIGEGGMGTVFEAEQLSPVRRVVAIKLIKWGMDSKQVIARFESERQALALMNHPNIARAYDAGATEQGRPYFVMEYVKGVPITEYCDTNRLTTAERLELFTQVCRGVQHAHQKGIIHRDLKPSNVLVTVADGEPVPKIIDFGVAKATSHRLTEKTVFTELGQMIGTPEYMSPEQAEMTGLDVDTRTDVYSLGVLLYELLVGALPFDSKTLRAVGFDEIRRRIREEEPLLPSARLSTLGDVSATSSRNRGASMRQLVQQLRGDLDWITMRALEKDRTRRYGSVSELEADVGRYLRDEPVQAGPPSVLYRARKFVRRHRAGVLAVLVVGLGLAAGIVGSTVGLVRAQREAETAKRVAGFLADMLGSVDAQRAGGNLREDLERRAGQAALQRGGSDADALAATDGFREIMAGVNWTDAGLQVIDGEILERAGRAIDEEFDGEPVVAARLQATIGRTYAQLGLYEEAEGYLVDALATREATLGRAHPDTLDSLNDYGLWLFESRRTADAEPYFREALEGYRSALGEHHKTTLGVMANLGEALRYQGRFDEAEPFIRGALEGLERIAGERAPRTLNSMNSLAELLHDQGELDEAEPYYRRVLDARGKLLGDDNIRTLVSLNNLAMLLQHKGDIEEAERLLREGVELRRSSLGDNHPMTLTAMNNFALALQGRGKLDEAEPFYLEALERRRRSLGPDNPDTLASIYNLGFLRKAQGRLDEAEARYREALAGFRRVLGDAHPSTLTVMHNTALLLRSNDRSDEAARLLHEAIAGRRETLGDGHYATVASIVNLGALLDDLGRFHEAEPFYHEAYETRRRELGDDHADTIRSAVELARLWVRMGRAKDAETLLDESRGRIEAAGGGEHSAYASLARGLVELYEAQDRSAEADPWRSR